MSSATNYEPLDDLGFAGWEATPAEMINGRLTCEVRFGKGIPTLLTAPGTFAMWVSIREHITACDALYQQHTPRRRAA